MRLKTMAIAFFALFLLSCNQEKVDSLTNEVEELTAKLSLAEQENSDLKGDLAKVQASFNRLEFLTKAITGIQARIVTNHGSIEVKFYPDKAPIQCFNFITRAESGFYDNTQFHRVMAGFMIQGGDPNSRDNNPADDGQGGPLVNIPHEFNDVNHVPGILSTARVPDKRAGAGSQFFIMHGTKPHLNGEYTAFGEVTKGMDVVNEIATVPTYKSGAGPANHPIKPVRILRVELYR